MASKKSDLVINKIDHVGNFTASKISVYENYRLLKTHVCVRIMELDQNLENMTTNTNVI